MLLGKLGLKEACNKITKIETDSDTSLKSPPVSKAVKKMLNVTMGSTRHFYVWIDLSMKYTSL
jgi:hypothetical protein